MNAEERIRRLLDATPEQRKAIDRILLGQTEPSAMNGPLLLGMGPAAKLLGVLRPTLWRLFKAERLQKFELLPNSFRVRRSDIEELVEKKATGS